MAESMRDCIASRTSLVCIYVFAVLCAERLVFANRFINRVNPSFQHFSVWIVRDSFP
jgi:hypothetical protein